MMRAFTIEDGQVPSKEQLDEVRSAAERAIQFDEDCPETTPERALCFRRVNPVRTVGTGG